MTQISFPADLPVSARRDEIAAAIRDHQVVIVAGETGSGKTTQLPKIALAAGRGTAGQIGHTQPRRIAARSVAERIAEELGTALGDVVGYQVRFTDETSTATRIKVMTDGILLAQIQRDPDLRAYDTLIIDEAHERSLNVDVLLGYLTRLLPRRPDLKVIITSATIDTARFAEHFSRPDAPPAPVIEVTGRTYPVEVRYRPLEGATRGEERDLMTGIVEACDELMAQGPGDVLVFLSGEREIRDAADALAGHLGPRATDARHPQAVELLPLYGRLSAAEQHRVFAAHGTRRIVLATNVAETSLTVPGIHYVVDPGTARISRYSKTTKVQRLPIEPISQASARQRSGRAGRLADGVAIRLYSEDDFNSRPEFTEPEILRTSLASVLLHMISVGVVKGVDDVAAFPFVDPPDTRAIRDGLQLLTDLGAVAPGRGGATRLTDVGRQLARLPIDPRQARMIVEGARRGVAYEATIVAAALSIQDPRERPTDRREEADAAHRRFSTPQSDLIAYLNLWAYLRERQKTLSGNAFRRLCKQEFLNYVRVREWQDLVEQLRRSAKGAGIAIKPHRAAPMVGGSAVAAPASADAASPAELAAGPAFLHVWDDDAVHRSLLAGLLTQIGSQEATAPKASSFTHLAADARAAAMRKARKQARNEYLGARGARFAISPASPLAKKPPAFVMAAELVETGRLWARDVARIDPAWAEELAGDLAKRSYAEPRWSAKRGAAVATEKVTLYGVPLVADRTVLWGRINPEEARELFIRHALVGGEWTTHHAFWRDNRALLAEAEELETRSRTYGIAPSEDWLVDFYDERLPENIVSVRHFDAWWKTARRANPSLLSLARADVFGDRPEADATQFPDRWPQGELSLPLGYAFQPGAASDGVTVTIPLAVLPQVRPEGFDWLVPGLELELVTALIRALPKPVRRLLVPAPDAADAIVAHWRSTLPEWAERVAPGGPSLRAAFAAAAKALRGADVPPDAWEEAASRLPAHLTVRYRVVEPDGTGERVVDESASLEALQRSLAARTTDAIRRAVAAQVASPQGRGHGKAGRGAAAGGAVAGDAAAGGAVAGDAAAGGALAGAAATPATVGLREVAALDTWPGDLPGGALPQVIETSVGAGVVVRGYPTLAAERGPRGPVVALRIAPDAATAAALHPAGVHRLLLSELALPVKRVTTRWTGTQALVLASSRYATTEALVDDLQLAAVGSLTGAGAAAGDAARIRDAGSYARALDALRPALEDEVHRIVALVMPILEAARALDATVRASTSLALLPTLADVRVQAESLVGPGFIAATPPARLPHLPRYLKAAARRIERAAEQPARDAEGAWRVRELADALAAVPAPPHPDPERAAAVQAIRWQLEELRVSVFAQQLGTDGPVSEKRIKAAIAALA